VLIALGYYAGCLAGFALRFPSSGISFFWPPTAVLTAALLLSAPRAWTALLGGAFVAHAIAHAQDGVPIAAWPIQFVGNAAQAIIAAALIRHFSGGAPFFTNARRVLIFIAASILAPATASLIPAYVYVNLGWAGDFSQAWRDRTVSNAVASLTLLPSILSVREFVQTPRLRIPARTGEYALLLLGILAAHILTGFIQRTDVLGLSLTLYAPVPLLLWATVRFGIAGASFALLWTTLLTVSNASGGYGPLANGTAADVVVGVWWWAFS
jgi:integral membrane sensor domain MASE1